MLGIEAAPSVGGTWYWNRYPGARCDVESVDYSYSFDEDLQSNWTWTERFAGQPEILAYLDHVADRFDLRRHYEFDTEVVGARFDVGRVGGADLGGRKTRPVSPVRHGLSVSGEPARHPGAHRFRGAGVLHRGVAPRGSRPAWQEDRRDRHRIVRHSSGADPRRAGRVACGFSALAQLHGADAQPPVVGGRPSADPRRSTRSGARGRRTRRPAHRTAPTTRARSKRIPRSGTRRCGAGGATAECCSARRFPIRRRCWQANDIARQFAENRIRDIVTDPDVADDLIPTDHPIGTKRICTDAGYYETFNRDNVRLVNLRREPIEAITTDGVRTAVGVVCVRCARVRNGFRCVDRCDDADRPGRSRRRPAVGNMG